MSLNTVAANEFVTQSQSGEVKLCIDVRTPVEYQARHCINSINIPLHELSDSLVANAIEAANLDKAETIYLMCKSGKRAEKASQLLLGKLHHPLAIVSGGVDALPDAAVQSGSESAISLERQVRIVAGALILLGVMLGSLINPWAYGLSAFVGAGLMFAGITDTCAMGMILARMPWNQIR